MIGSETSGGIRDVTIRRIRCGSREGRRRSDQATGWNTAVQPLSAKQSNERTLAKSRHRRYVKSQTMQAAIHIKTGPGRGGVIENILIQDVTLLSPVYGSFVDRIE